MNDDKKINEEKEDQELADLLAEAKSIDEEVSSISKDFDSEMDNFEKSIDGDIKDISNGLRELDEEDKKASQDFERLMMENAEEISKEKEGSGEEN